MKFLSLLTVVWVFPSSIWCEASGLSRGVSKATSHDLVGGSLANVTIPVKIPNGWLAGMTLTVSGPDGHKAIVKVPASLSVGDVFNYTYMLGDTGRVEADGTEYKGVRDEEVEDKDDDGDAGDDEDVKAVDEEEHGHKGEDNNHGQEADDDDDQGEKTNGANVTENVRASRTATLPKEPFSYLYHNANKVAHDTEMRYRPSFFPEGTHVGVDMGVNEVHETETIFSQQPSPFANCLLIRDYAMPLRVGTSLQELSSRFLKKAAGMSLEPQGIHEAAKHAQHHLEQSHRTQAKRRNVKSISLSQLRAAAKTNESSVVPREVQDEALEDDEEDLQEEQSKVPDNMLIMKGGVIDRDIPDEESGNDSAEFAVNMFAFLQSVSGEVRVVPHGTIAKWSSKRKVPIAGYLCTEDTGPVLYTLETPCVHTALGEDGIPLGAPPPSPRRTNNTQLEPNEQPHKLEFTFPVGVGSAPAPALAHGFNDASSSPAPAPAPAMMSEPLGMWPRDEQDTVPSDVVQCDVEVANSICLGSTMLLPPARMTGLQGHWSFDEVWPFDGSGNRLDGRTRHVAGPALGQGNSALFHERSPIEVRHTGQLTAQSFSYTFWIFLIDMGVHEREDGEACTVLATGPREDPASRAVLVDPGSGELRIECPTRDEADDFIRSQSRLETNRWYHVALVRLDGERRTRLYVNGILDSSVMTTGYTAVPDTRAFFLGGRPEEPGCSAAMYLDEVKVFDRPLLPDEIQAEAALSLGGIEASFFRLACLSCPLEEAAKNCPEAYHICSDLELHFGGYAVARSLGWLQQSSHVWGRAKEVDKTAAHPRGGPLEQVTHTPGPPTSPESEVGTMGLGLCCADG
uniref:DUF8019 domain-containing protein n=1 Tax=Noctiluca scintillans TaxID=2966 RepID=A0A7S1EZS1_NOCSC|mmetsp:Transcript_22658/g.59777  ORF Transcript_22658/g.59777 Transcript_22658/m.59777 type:complete len:853 (+) Transcript_22658:56-2614(+)